MSNKSALEIACLVEEKKKLTFVDIKPKIRKELVTDYCLSVTRTKDKQWRVAIDAPKRIDHDEPVAKKARKSTDEKSVTKKKSNYNGEGEIERLFKGGTPLSEGKHGPMHLSYRSPNEKIIELLEKKGLYVIKKLSFSGFSPQLIDYCKTNGYLIAQTPNYTYGCGHDDCHYCYECRHKIPKISGYSLYISKSILPRFQEQKEL